MHDCIVRNIRLLGPRGWQEADLAIDYGLFFGDWESVRGGRDVVDGAGSFASPEALTFMYILTNQGAHIGRDSQPVLSLRLRAVALWWQKCL